MKSVRYGRHAKRRMKERDVTEKEVETAINEPEYIEPSIKERQNAYKFIGGRFLRVTFRRNKRHYDYYSYREKTAI